MIAVDAFGAARRGGRATNEDRVVCAPEIGLFAVFDGMGGHPRGHEAAQYAADRLTELCTDRTPGTGLLARYFAKINDELLLRSATLGLEKPMATVGTAVWIDASARMHVAHVGDTRAWRFDRSGIGSQLTTDHAGVDFAGVPERQAMASPHRHVVTRAIGLGPVDDAWVDVSSSDLPADSALLIVSDGVSDAMTGAALSALVASQHHLDARRAVNEIHRRALEAQAHAEVSDNIGVVLVRRMGAAPTWPSRLIDAWGGIRSRIFAFNTGVAAIAIVASFGVAAALQATPTEGGPRLDGSVTSIPALANAACRNDAGWIDPECGRAPLTIGASTGEVRLCGRWLQSAVRASDAWRALDCGEVRIARGATVTWTNWNLVGAGPRQVIVEPGARLFIRDANMEFDQPMQWSISSGAEVHISSSDLALGAADFAIDPGGLLTLSETVLRNRDGEVVAIHQLTTPPGDPSPLESAGLTLLLAETP